MENVQVETTVFNVLDNFPPPALWTESGDNQSSNLVVNSPLAGGDLSGSLVEKSPISLLQELCMKRGLTPHYELTDSEGPVHQRVFTYKVTAGSFTAVGKGKAIVGLLFSLSCTADSV